MLRETELNALSRYTRPGEDPVVDLLRRQERNAEKAFCSVFPVGREVEPDLNLGAVYLQMRKLEDPRYRRKEAELLYGAARPLWDGLSREIVGFLRGLENRIPRMDDNADDRKARLAALRQAEEVIRTIGAVLSRMDADMRNYDLKGLRSALVGLRSVARD